MRIIEVELKNHIVIGDVHIKTDNEINAFIGVNGSGKSILLSTLQPFGTSDRYSMAYPIIPEKSGYKKIVYQIGDITYETIHEYTPNKQKHSCKSYLNRIINGNVEELNPNGHVNLYEELVEKHLHFTRDVLDICYITSKADGLTSATPKRRKEILEVTNSSSILLKDYQKIISELVKDNKAVQRILGEKRVALLNNKTESMLADEIHQQEIYLKQEEKLYNDAISNKVKSLAELENINKLEFTKKELDQIKNITSILDYFQKGTLLDLQGKYNDYTSRIEKSSLEIQLLEREYTEYTLKEQKAKELDYLTRELKEQTTLYEKCKNVLSSLFKTTDYKSVIDGLNTLKRVYIPIINYIISYDVEFHNSLNRYSLPKLYDIKKSQLEEIKSFIAVYNSKLEDSNINVNFNVNDINIQDNCKVCPLYNKMVLSTEFITSNKVKYDESLELIPSLEQDIKLIDKILTVEEQNTAIIKPLIDQLTGGGLTKTGFSLSIVEMYKLNKQYNEIINYLLEMIENYYISSTTIENINQQIKLHELTSLEDIKSKLATISNKIEKIKNTNQYLLGWLNDYNSHNVNEIIMSAGEYLSKNINQLNEVVNKFQNKYQLMVQVEQTLATIDNTIKSHQLNIDKLKNDIIISKNNLQELQNTLNTLKGIITKGEYYKNIKILLEKDIPILLLQSQLEYIQYQTNQILEDNDIDIQIEIKSTGSDIIIPAYINGRINPDIRNVSQGESCLISLLINACMCHILGYNIIYLDEIDANLDSINRDKFNNIIYSILSHLNINQIFCISHNIANSVESAQLYALGNNWRNLNFGRTSQVIEI